MQKLILYIICFIAIASFSCSRRLLEFPFLLHSYSYAELLIGDSSIFNKKLDDQVDSNKLVNVFGGISFLDSNGTIKSNPMKKLKLNNEQINELKKIFSNDHKDDQVVSAYDCLPIFRHAILFYESNGHVAGGILICLDCKAVNSFPLTSESFTVDFNRINHFFKKNNVFDDYIR